MKPSSLGGLETLPTGYLGYTAMEWGPEALKALQPLLLGITGAPEGEQGKALQKALDQFAAAGPSLQRIASGLGGKGLQVTKFNDPAKAAAAQLDALRALEGLTMLGTMPLKEKPVIRPDAETFRGVKYHYFGVKWDFEKQLEKLPGGGEKMAEALKKLTGEGLSMWFGPVEGALVQVSAKDWKAAEKALTQYLDKTAAVGAKHPSFAQTRERLPAKATLVSLLSVARTIDIIAQYGGAVAASFGGPALPKLAASKEPEFFLGTGVTLRSGYAGLDVWVPGATAREVRRVFEGIHDARGQ
jgi:hypothetical protein